MLLNVLDYDGRLDSALAIAADGDRIYMPSRQPYTAPETGWVVSKSVEIFGDGPGRFGDASGTLLRGFTGNSPVLIIRPSDGASNVGPVYIHDLKIADAQYGIRCLLDDGEALDALRLERVLIVAMSKTAYSLDPFLGNIKLITVFGCRAVNNAEYGFKLRNVTMARLLASGGGSNSLGNTWCEGSSVGYYAGTGAEGDGAANATRGQLYLEFCKIGHVEASTFEQLHVSSSGIGCEFSDVQGAAFFGGNYFSDAGGDSTTGFVVDYGGPVLVFSNNFTQVTPTLITVSGGVKGCTILPQYNVEQSGPGDILIPEAPNNGVVGVPAVMRLGGVYVPSGLVIPSRSGAPTSPVQEGMIFYDTELGALRILTEVGWKSVSTT